MTRDDWHDYGLLGKTGMTRDDWGLPRMTRDDWDD